MDYQEVDFAAVDAAQYARWSREVYASRVAEYAVARPQETADQAYTRAYQDAYTGYEGEA